MNAAPFPDLNKKVESKTIEIEFKGKKYPLEIILNQGNIKFNIQEKYDLFSYQATITYQDFLNLHKYFRFFDNIKEIYNDLIKGKILIKEIDESNKRNLTILYKISINNNNYDINFTLNKKELDKVKDMDIIISNYYLMKKELDELKRKYNLNDNNNNLFDGSLWLNSNDRAINLIQAGINHQLQKKIVKTDLLYRCSRDGDSNDLFHSKCDGIDNTLIIGESTNGRIFGGFTTQKWNDRDMNGINDDYSFLFQINDLKNYYAIIGKGGIYCSRNYGPAFVANLSSIQFCFQSSGKAFEKNNFDLTNSTSNFGYDFNGECVLEGNNNFTLKDYEVYKLYIN